MEIRNSQPPDHIDYIYMSTQANYPYYIVILNYSGSIMMTYQDNTYNFSI